MSVFGMLSVLARESVRIRDRKDFYLEFLQQHDFYPNPDQDFNLIKQKYKNLYKLMIIRASRGSFEYGGELHDLLRIGKDDPLYVFKQAPHCAGWIAGVTSPGVIDSLNNPCYNTCLLYTSPSPRDRQKSRMPSSA